MMDVLFDTRDSAIKLVRIAVVVCTITFLCAPAGVASHCMTHAVFAEEDVLFGEKCSRKALKGWPIDQSSDEKKHINDADCLSPGSEC